MHTDIFLCVIFTQNACYIPYEINVAVTSLLISCLWAGGYITWPQEADSRKEQN